MKGTLFCDWGYIFDFYSIFLVKLEKGLDVKEQAHECLSCIVGQLGDKKTEEILMSKEFENLFLMNMETFDAVDLARSNKILASEVDLLNSKRAKAKKQLHEKFFGTPYGEVKNVNYGDLEE